jgi:hypothetical protein
MLEPSNSPEYYVGTACIFPQSPLHGLTTYLKNEDFEAPSFDEASFFGRGLPTNRAA